MGKIHDQNELAKYTEVLLTLGHVSGYINWKRLPREWMDRNLPSCTQKSVHQLMVDHVRNGGRITQTVETRPEYTEWRFHYDLRMPITDRRVYIETVFTSEEDLDDCVIYVVNIHDV